MTAIGFNIAAASLVGNALGANKYKLAKQYTDIAILIATVASLIFVLSLLCFSNSIISIFTKHENVKDEAVKCIPILCVLLVPDFIQATAQGIITAMGYQQKGSYWCLFCYWFISTPLSALLAFHYDMGLRGIFIGPTVGLTCIAIAYLYLIYSTDWKILSEKIHDRILQEKQSLNNEI